jgi:hypothetical protein
MLNTNIIKSCCLSVICIDYLPFFSYLCFIYSFLLKKNLVIVCLLFSSVLINAQSWQPVGNGVNGYVNILFVYDSVMYAGGSFTSPGNNIAQWNDTTWDSLSSGTNNEVYAINKYKGLVYVGGWFSQAGGHSAGNIATWNGKSFANAGFNLEGGLVDVIHPYDSLLYVGGQFDSVNHKRPSGLVTWNGNKVDSVGYTSYWSNTSILATYNNLLFLGFAPTGSGTPLMTWNNKTIKYVGNDYFKSDSTNANLFMNAFCQAKGNLYLGGSFLSFFNFYHTTQDTIVNNIAIWDGSKWSSMGKGIHGTVYALVSYNNLIIAGGSFDSAGGIPANNIAAWNGVSWSALGNGIDGAVYALAVFDSTLYAGGDFSSPGNGIVKFAATPKITPIINIDSVNVFPNPNTGEFTVVCNKTIITGTLVTIEIYNSIGEKIYSSNLINENTTIDLGKQPTGVYIYKVFTSEGNLISPGKFVIE